MGLKRQFSFDQKSTGITGTNLIEQIVCSQVDQ